MEVKNELVERVKEGKENAKEKEATVESERGKKLERERGNEVNN